MQNSIQRLQETVVEATNYLTTSIYTTAASRPDQKNRGNLYNSGVSNILIRHNEETNQPDLYQKLHDHYKLPGELNRDLLELCLRCNLNGLSPSKQIQDGKNQQQIYQKLSADLYWHRQIENLGLDVRHFRYQWKGQEERERLLTEEKIRQNVSQREFRIAI